MIAVRGTYHDGKIKLSKEIKTNKPIQVIVTFLDDKIENPSQKLTRDKFNFDKTREILKDINTNFSDTLIDERRENL
jgi:hypothetical protein